MESVDPHERLSPQSEHEDVQRTTNPALACLAIPSGVAIPRFQTRYLDGGTSYGEEGREDHHNAR